MRRTSIGGGEAEILSAWPATGSGFQHWRELFGGEGILCTSATTAPMTRFHELYEKYSRDVYRFALYLSGDPALADDVTSETFVRVWSSPEPVRLATVKAYLLSIARNLWLIDGARALPTPSGPGRNYS